MLNLCAAGRHGDEHVDLVGEARRHERFKKIGRSALSQCPLRWHTDLPKFRPWPSPLRRKQTAYRARTRGGSRPLADFLPQGREKCDAIAVAKPSAPLLRGGLK
jgi:hypothetical protein